MAQNLHNVTLALVAHDRKKEQLADFIADHRHQLAGFNLVATRGTGQVIQRVCRMNIPMLERRPNGQDTKLSHLAEENRVQVLFFFRDPEAEPHEPDFADLLATCDREEVLVATNRASAEALLYFLLNSPDRGAITARPWAFS